MLEEQVADLRKQLSTVEHDLCASREDMKSLQQQLRDKVREGRMPRFFIDVICYAFAECLVQSDWY